MGQIKISKEQQRFQLRFSKQEPIADAQRTAPATPSALSDGEKTQLSKAYLERFGPRKTGHALDMGEHMALEVAYQSQGPNILTQTQEDEELSSLKALNKQSEPESLESTTIMAGTSVKAGEHVKLNTGLATSGDIIQDLKETGVVSAPGVYAGVEVESESVAGKVSVDTALGAPRIEAGVALNADNNVTVGVNYQAGQQDAIKMGVEYRQTESCVIGVNIHQPIEGNMQESLSVGTYLKARFH